MSQGERTDKKKPRRQGKAWNKQEVVETLKPYFQIGCSISKACAYAGIAESTVKTWFEADPELRLKIMSWQNQVSAMARMNLARSIQPIRDESGNIVSPGNNDNSKWWIERKEKDEFAPRQEQTGPEGGPIVIVDAGKNPYKSGEADDLISDKLVPKL